MELRWRYRMDNKTKYDNLIEKKEYSFFWGQSTLWEHGNGSREAYEHRHEHACI